MATFEKRPTKDGKTIYRVKIRLKGYPSASESFERLADAKRWAQKTETEILEGRHFGKLVIQNHTLEEAIDRYSAYLALNNPRRLNDIKLCLAWWRKRLGSYFLSSLSKAIIAEARDELMREELKRGKRIVRRSNSTVNRYVSALRTLLNYTVDEWEWLEKNPIKNFRDLIEPKGRSRYLSEDERHALLQACKESDNPYLYSIVILAISCGARKSEINCIKWEHVHLDKKFIVLLKTKNKESRVIHLHGEAFAEIQRLRSERDQADKYVFPSKNPDKPLYFKTSWNTALKRAKLENFKFHDLRHTAASYLAMNGANIKDIATILGHKSLAMTDRYAHLCNTHTANVVERMNDNIFGAKAT